MKKSRMVNLRVREITLCRKGMNNKQYILRKEHSIMPTFLEKIKDVKIDDKAIDGTLSKEKPETQELVKAAIRLLKSVEVTPEITSCIQAQTGLNILDEAAVTKMIETKLQKKQDDDKAKADVLAKAQSGELDLSTIKDPVMKSVLTDVMAKQKKATEELAKAEKVAKESSEKIAKMEKDALRKEYVVKVSTLTALAESAETIADTLLTIEKQETRDKVEKLLQAANKSASSSAIFEEFGSAHSGNALGDAASQVERMAKESVEKSSGKLTVAQARAKIWKENPELADKWDQENR